MRKRWMSLYVMVCMLFMLAGCGESGNPPILTVDGIEMTLGTSRPIDLTSKGFESSFAGGYLVIGELAANSWMSDLMSIQKDKETYAYVYIYNPTNEAETYSFCNIYKIKFKMNSEEESFWAENNVLVNGIDFYGLTVDEVKENMQDFKLASETDTSVHYEDGSYNYYFRFDDNGIIEEIEVEMEIRKSY